MHVVFTQRAERNVSCVHIIKTPMGSCYVRKMLIMFLRHMEKGWGEENGRKPVGLLCCARCAHSLETKDSGASISISFALATVQLFSLVDIVPIQGCVTAVWDPAYCKSHPLQLACCGLQFTFPFTLL